MSDFKILMKEEFNTSPEQLYADWLNSEGHEKLTGGAANIQEILNSEYTAWDGYISGRLTELDSGKKIVQTWRTSEFSSEHEDSILEIKLEPSDKGTLLTLLHTNLASENEVEKYTSGWEMHYFEPMRDLYNN